ncbi:Imm10 family immunity protein [Micromonospora zhanjiangensis]|uniref:Imm10 family immunity protein n=1 Tax=Micromonospora zhanjiangensis TaxID=1522057 RepID=A0ABV8KXI6_9ACTN
MGEDASDGYVIGLRESTRADSWSLLFMAALDEDLDEEDLDDEDPDDESDFEDDTYCLVVDPGQATHYGGVRECHVTDRQLRLALTPDAANTLGLPTNVTFELDLPDHQLAMLRQGLVRVLTSGHPEARPAILGT